MLLNDSLICILHYSTYTRIRVNLKHVLFVVLINLILSDGRYLMVLSGSLNGPLGYVLITLQKLQLHIRAQIDFYVKYIPVRACFLLMKLAK